MGLIKCKECGQDLSDKARKCPHCGADALTATGVTAGQRFLGCFLVLLAIGFVVLCIALVNNGNTVGWLSMVAVVLTAIYGFRLLFGRSRER
jgi:hypothetical protein